MAFSGSKTAMMAPKSFYCILFLSHLSQDSLGLLIINICAGKKGVIISTNLCWYREKGEKANACYFPESKTVYIKIQ